jgi:hypothetical protein
LRASGGPALFFALVEGVGAVVAGKPDAEVQKSARYRQRRNVVAILKTRFGADISAFCRREACVPGLARRSIKAAPSAGVLLPGSAGVGSLGEGGTSVDFMVPVMVLGLAQSPTVDAVAAEARAIPDHGDASLQSS